jgi:molybdate transport system ATP-binding protein
MDPLRLALDVPLRDFALRVELSVEREVLALVGPSGAGKTTLLRAIAGLAPASGTIAVDGRTWLDTARAIDVPAEDRSVGMVFQDYALFPHLSVRSNVAFGRDARVAGLLERFGIAHLANAKPRELSGGEGQRVALARALARNPAVLLLDEPLAALDAHTRDVVRAELHELLGRAERPAIVVTHDFEDAAALADRVGVLVDGRLRQVGPASELVAAPTDEFVATLTGANVLRGIARPIDGSLTELTLATGERLRSADAAEGEAVAVVYPWEVTLAREAHDDSAQNQIAGAVTSVVEIGSRARVRVGVLTAEITRDSRERLAIAPGAPVYASFKATATRLLPVREEARAGYLPNVPIE